MNSEKQQLASAVKQQAEALQSAIEAAEAAGLSVTVDAPNKYLGSGSPTKGEVVIFEKVVY